MNAQFARIIEGYGLLKGPELKDRVSQAEAWARSNPLDEEETKALQDMRAFMAKEQPQEVASAGAQKPAVERAAHGDTPSSKRPLDPGKNAAADDQG